MAGKINQRGLITETFSAPGCGQISAHLLISVFNQFTFLNFTFLFIFNRCTNESEENLLNGKVCDTLNLTYSNDIKPILEANCYSCHDNTNSCSCNFNIQNFEELKAMLVNGTLISAINRIPGYRYQMPYGKPKLPDCTIKKISAWNNAGHLQN